MKIEEMIQQFCPDGVPYKTLGDISTITRGGNFQKKRLRGTGISMYSLWADLYKIQFICDRTRQVYQH